MQTTTFLIHSCLFSLHFTLAQISNHHYTIVTLHITLYTVGRKLFQNHTTHSPPKFFSSIRRIKRWLQRAYISLLYFLHYLLGVIAAMRLMENRSQGDSDIQRLALALHLASQDELWLGRISTSRVNDHAESIRDFFHHHPAQPSHANEPSRPGRIEDFYRGYNEPTNNLTQRRPSHGATCRPPYTDNHTDSPVASTCHAASLSPSTLPATIPRAIIHASP